MSRGAGGAGLVLSADTMTNAGTITGGAVGHGNIANGATGIAVRIVWLAPHSEALTRSCAARAGMKVFWFFLQKRTPYLQGLELPRLISRPTRSSS